jgi:hypothetical protein
MRDVVIYWMVWVGVNAVCLFASRSRGIKLTSKGQGPLSKVIHTASNDGCQAWCAVLPCCRREVGPGTEGVDWSTDLPYSSNPRFSSKT